MEVNNQNEEVLVENQEQKATNIFICIAAGTLAVSGCYSLFNKIRRKKQVEEAANALEEKVITNLIK